MPAERDLLLYRRQSQGKTILVALNFGADPISLTLEVADFSGKILLSTVLDRRDEEIQGSLDLRGNEGVIIAISSAQVR